MVQAIKRDEVYIEPEGIYVETQQPERRSRKPPLLLVHGALTGSWLWSEFGAYFAERGWEAHAMNLRGHFTSDVADLGRDAMRDYADDIGVAVRQLGRPPVLIGWGIGALAAMLYAERHRVLGLVLLAPSPPAGGAAAAAGRARAACRAADLRRRVGGAGPDPRRAARADAGHGRRRAREDAGDARRRARVGQRPTRADAGRAGRHRRASSADAWSSAPASTR